MRKFWGYYKKNRWVLRSLFKTIYFNFRLLPFSQAIKFPIWLYKPRFGRLTGKVILDFPDDKLKPGIICLGNKLVDIYPNTGCYIDIRGRIVFKGLCNIGNNSYISVGETGRLELGDNCTCTTSIKLVCYNSIKIGCQVLIGWDCLLMDTDFHCLKREDGTKTLGYGSIEIGDYTWLGCGCKLFKRTVVPPRCVVSAQTIISEDVEAQECSIIGTEFPIHIKAKGYYRDCLDDKVIYNINK